MGIVYKAEQREPVRRIVALKVIKLGMSTSARSRTARRPRSSSKEHAMLAQINPSDITPEHVFFFVALTLVFLLVAWFFHIRPRPLGTSLIWWGILVVILSFGYAMIGVPSMVVLTPSLMKIGFLLVLACVACSLLASCPKQASNKEADHV